MKARGSVVVPRLAPLEADCLAQLLEQACLHVTWVPDRESVAAALVLPRRQPPQPVAPVCAVGGEPLPTLLLVHPVDFRALALAKAVDARSVLDLNTEPETIVSTVRALVRGAPTQGPQAPRATEWFAGLTIRERDILALAAAGVDDHRIGAHLGITPSTVRAHVDHLQRKLGAEHRQAAIRLAQENTHVRSRMWELTSLTEAAGVEERA